MKYSDMTLEDIENQPWTPLRKKLIEYVCTTGSDFNCAVTLTFERPITSRYWGEQYGVRFQQFCNNALLKPNWQRRYKNMKGKERQW